VTGTIDGGSGPLYLGNEYVGGHGLAGVLDDVRIYDCALTGIDVADLYARSRRGATGG